jgi:pimeloyl-ACP methyl ester carboxylesterase
MDEQIKSLEKGTFAGTCYRDTGEGIPVMLVHGFPVDGSLWDAVAASLNKQFRLLIPDLPGSGSSPLANPINMETLADLLSGILEQEAVDQCVLIGHSMGGYIALALAEAHPDKLLGFGLFHSSAFADTAEKKEGRLRSIGLMKQYGAAAFIRQMMPTLFSRGYRKNHTAEMQAVIQSREAANVDALTAYYHAMMVRPDRTRVLQQTKVPVLFVIGKEDTAAAEKDVLKQVTLPAISDVQLLKDVAHLGMLEKPERSAELLKNFIHLCRNISQKEQPF